MTLGLDGSVQVTEKQDNVTATHESPGEFKKSLNDKDDGQCDGHSGLDSVVGVDGTGVVSHELLNDDNGRQASSESVEEDNPVTHHPVDGGYAWVVLIAVFFVQFLLIGYTKSIGIIFVEFQSKFGSNASMTSLIVSVTEAVGSLGSFLVMGFLTKVLSPRSIAMIGCLFFTAGVAGNSLFKQLEYLCLTQGVMYGMATCMIYGPSLFVVTQYFVKRRPLAAAIASCGTSFGGMVFPMLIRRLVDEFSFEGGILLTAGVVMHAFVFSSLLTPIQMYDRTKSGSKAKKSSLVDKIRHRFKGRVAESENNNSEETLPLNKPGSGNIPDDQLSREQSNNNVKLGVEDPQRLDIENMTDDGEKFQNNHDDKQVFETTKNSDGKHIYVKSEAKTRNTLASTGLMDSSQSGAHNSKLSGRSNKAEPGAEGGGRLSIDIEEDPDMLYKARRKMSQISATTSLFVSTSNIHVSYADVIDQGGQGQPTSKSGSGSHLNVFRRTMIRCGQSTLVRSASFWALTVFYFFAMVGNAIPQTYIPAFAKERGLSDADGAFFLSLLNVLDFPARMCCGIIVNFRLIRPTTACIPPMLVVALVGHLTPLFTSYESILGMVIAYGLCLGIYFAMQSLIVIDVLGIENFRTAIGFYYLFMGLGGAVSYPIAGTLKDVTGTYTSTYHYLATMNLVAVFQLLVVVPLTKRYDVRRGVLQETDPNK